MKTQKQEISRPFFRVPLGVVMNSCLPPYLVEIRNLDEYLPLHDCLGIRQFPIREIWSRRGSQCSFYLPHSRTMSCVMLSQEPKRSTDIHITLERIIFYAKKWFVTILTQRPSEASERAVASGYLREIERSDEGVVPRFLSILLIGITGSGCKGARSIHTVASWPNV